MFDPDIHFDAPDAGIIAEIGIDPGTLRPGPGEAGRRRGGKKSFEEVNGRGPGRKSDPASGVRNPSSSSRPEGAS